MLSWSAQETGRTLDLAGIADPTVDPGIPAGRQLVTLGRAVVDRRSGRQALDAVAAEIGDVAAFDAAAVAANFEVMNRVVDAVGLPVGQRSRETAHAIIEMLGLEAFSHARH